MKHGSVSTIMWMQLDTRHFARSKVFLSVVVPHTPSESNSGTCRCQEALPQKCNFIKPQQKPCQTLQRALQAFSCWPRALSRKTEPATALKCGQPTARADDRLALIKLVIVGFCYLPRPMSLHQKALDTTLYSIKWMGSSHGFLIESDNPHPKIALN